MSDSGASAAGAGISGRWPGYIGIEVIMSAVEMIQDEPARTEAGKGD
jgi:hypothetical protein